MVMEFTQPRSMLALRFRRFTPLILLLALIQAMAPALAAVADGWRLDQREPYAHVESETGPGCVIVHQHDCALCSVATSANGEEARRPSSSAVCAQPAVVIAAAIHRPSAHFARAASQRAPPEAQG